MNIPDPQPYLTNPLSATNYAVASAKTGSGNPQDVSNQVSIFQLAHSQAPSSALYAIWAGSNDILNGNVSPSAATQSADSLYANIVSLASGGAKYFLWLDLPPLGETPLARTAGPQTAAALNAASNAFNAEWVADIAKLQSLGIDVIGVDINNLFNQISGNPSAYGFTNVTDPAQGISGDPNRYAFWDMRHPTTAGHALVANLAFNDVVASPEPTTFLLALIGIGGVLVARKHYRRTGRS
jgi:phospholipase/lecithinase/hemolysin